ncbi:Uncharacterized protein TCM_016465 [Theobroma cacao]|uniref:Uncharacterized protein n=1 Tax=Theobroma cacao TaxID=3641 RepID=A0A061G6I0_THECC|nr:Uncharacterized protein TCM_016465 [Theobroma cacao]
MAAFKLLFFFSCLFFLQPSTSHQRWLVADRFPFSGKFKVEILDYMWQYIWISDPSDCIAERGLQGFDLSGTPLELLYLQSFTILNYSSGLPSNAERGTAMLVAAAGNSICFCIIGRIIKRVTAIIVRIPTLKSLTHQQP